MKLGQRTALSLLTIILLGAGAILGTASGYPELSDGTIFRPEILIDTLVTALVPAIMVFVSLSNVLKSVNERVQNGTLQPGDLIALFQKREIYIHIAVVLIGAGQIFGFEPIEGEEGVELLATFIQSAMAILLAKLAPRETGQAAAQG